ncbi:MAG TPA: acyltransferase [Terracidiphilus sp.]|nr:acyltransferase [Terracidiphilus sp.]
MSSANPIRITRSARFAWARLRGRMACAGSGIQAGRGVDVIGAPVIALHPQSGIVLGDSARLISVSFATALGVNHPVVLRTLAAGAEIRIGARVGISGGSICAAQRVEIGEDTMLGANVTIADTDFHSLHTAHRSGHMHPTVAVAPVRIGRGVFLGTGAIVLKGVTIGDHSVIGAGSVVTKSIPENCIAAGNPCRVLRLLTPEELEMGVAV